ncbi:MAG: Gfo/Idh/MocA family oxidoreductase [Cyclobacteriaceae bacterium]|nr:Gfo/Idh/MocA family oxidoreductase [Cyclobacteriaceae bacterium]
MNKNIKRRDFVKISAITAGSMALSNYSMVQAAPKDEKPLRIGFVGVGSRGSYHLDAALGIEGVVVPALCDIKDAHLHRAKRWVEGTGQPTPNLYGKSDTDFVRMCEQEELDVVICATSWKWHAQVCIAAMKNGKHAVSEVPIILTLDEAWEVVETSEKTGKWATLALEQALLESNYAMGVLNMIRQGVFGEVIHCVGGYVHDLRMVKFNPEEEPWRLQHSIDRNGNLYPDHPMNKIMAMMNINHGDRLDYIVSVSSGATMLNEYAKNYYGEGHPYAKLPMAQGDVNVSLLRTVKDKMITLNFDTNTPHPRGIFKVQGTKGVFLGSRGIGTNIYIDGISPESHQWESAEKWIEEYQHPLVKNYNPPPRKEAIRGHGSQGMKTPLTWHLLAQALRAGEVPYFDVYDSVTSSAVSPLSEASVAKKGQPVQFPDFTKGKWEKSSPIDFG